MCFFSVSSFVRYQHWNTADHNFICILNTNEDIFVIHQSIFDSIFQFVLIQFTFQWTITIFGWTVTCSGCNVNIGMRFVCVSNAVNLHINTGWMVRSLHTQKNKKETPQNQWNTLYSQTHGERTQSQNGIVLLHTRKYITMPSILCEAKRMEKKIRIYSLPGIVTSLLSFALWSRRRDSSKEKT